jgi:secreted trypsin-like serine protease
MLKYINVQNRIEFIFYCICFNKVCGNATSAQNTRIVGGVQAIPYSWPAQVYIRQTIYYKIQIGSDIFNRSKSFTCGGTIINKNTILGAAHCIANELKIEIDSETVLFNLPNDDISVEYSVYVGAFNISFIDRNESSKLPTIKMAVRKVIRVN